MNKNSHLSPFSSSSVAEATIEEKEKTFEMILRQQIQGMHNAVKYSLAEPSHPSIKTFFLTVVYYYCYYYFLWNTGSFSVKI